MKANLANLFTAIRIFLALPIFFFLLSDILYARILVIILFCFAGFTDYLDGKMARLYGGVTEFGKFIDPLADKILVVSILIGLAILNEVQFWMVFLIAARELIVTIFRAGSIEKFSPTFLAKSKTAFQMVGIGIILFIPFLKLGSTGNVLNHIIMSSMLAITLISGLHYLGVRS